MLYTKIVTERDKDIFQQKLDWAIDDSIIDGDILQNIFFSTCADTLAPCAPTADADTYSVTRYTALLLFFQKD